MKNDVSERIYLSKKLKPLGEVPPNNLPSTIDRYTQIFGISSHKDISATEIVNPPKTRDQVELESQAKHSMYAFSHDDYDVGEQKTYRYGKNFDKEKRFGLSTSVYHDGRAARGCLEWLPTKLLEERAQADSKRLDNFREKHTKQLGKPLDPFVFPLSLSF